VASLIRRVENLVVENGEVEGKTKTDGMRWREISLSNVGSGSVGLERLVGRCLALVAKGELSKVTMVITLPIEYVSLSCAPIVMLFCLHLVVEDLGLAALSRGDKVLIENLKNILTYLGKFGLDLLTVLLDQRDLAVIAL
jgi:hypothetical protein